MVAILLWNIYTCIHINMYVHTYIYVYIFLKFFFSRISGNRQIENTEFRKYDIPKFHKKQNCRSNEILAIVDFHYLNSIPLWDILVYIHTHPYVFIHSNNVSLFRLHSNLTGNNSIYMVSQKLKFTDQC